MMKLMKPFLSSLDKLREREKNGISLKELCLKVNQRNVGLIGKHIHATKRQY